MEKNLILTAAKSTTGKLSWVLTNENAKILNAYNSKGYFKVYLKGFNKEDISFETEDRIIDSLIIDINTNKCEIVDGEVVITYNKEANQTVSYPDSIEGDHNDDYNYIHIVKRITTKKEPDDTVLTKPRWYVYRTPRQDIEGFLLEHAFLDKEELMSNEVFNEILKNSGDLGTFGNYWVENQSCFEVRWDKLNMNLFDDGDLIHIGRNHSFKFKVGYDNKIYLEITGGINEMEK